MELFKTWKKYNGSLLVLNLKLELFIETVIGQRAFMILGIFYT